MRLILAFTSLSVVMIASLPAAGDPPGSPAVSDVKNVSFDRATPREQRDRVTFSKRSGRVGDEVEQSLDLEMRLVTTKRQGNAIGEKSQTTARNQQRRVVTTTHVENGQTVAVRVRYLEATKQMAADAKPASVGDASKTAQPVAGKTYLCKRLPGKDGTLAITDEAGHIPPTDEYEIVAQHMEMVGRPNPLAEFLAGKSLAVGQTIELPHDVASKVFNLGEQFGEIKSFELTLKSINQHGERAHGEFVARVEAASNNASQMRMQLEGPLVMEIDTCRTVNLDLTGPIAMSETRGSYSTSYQVIGTGHLKAHIASQFRDAKR
jgi:hypothetical protein